MDESPMECRCYERICTITSLNGAIGRVHKLQPNPVSPFLATLSPLPTRRIAASARSEWFADQTFMESISQGSLWRVLLTPYHITSAPAAIVVKELNIN
ncbi:hypothetical protein E2P81_ATG09990 [Venturia nashicola]|nr:hypothetical protein E2P81_ATG09990 [Venturia nashicola]